MKFCTRHGIIRPVKQLPILIAGGGIAGIAAALAAASAGREALVFERAAAFEEVGAGLQIGPNAAKALQRIGAWEQVAMIASAPPAIVIRDAMNGKTVRRIQLAGVFEQKFGAPYRVAHRADLHRALLAAAQYRPEVTVRGGNAAADVAESGGTITLTLQDGARFEGELLLAADGMRSGLRQKLWPGSASVFAGQIIYRALIQNPRNLADGDCVNLWMGPGFHVVHYPVSTRGMLNVVFVSHDGRRPEEIAEYCSQALGDLLAPIPTWLLWEARYVPPLSTWVKGRIALLGDAAHGTVPYFAQGSAMALEDAALFADILQEAGALPVNIARLNERMARVAAMHKASVRQGRIYGARGLTAVARNSALKWLPERRFLDQLAWIYRHGSDAL